MKMLFWIHSTSCLHGPIYSMSSPVRGNAESPQILDNYHDTSISWRKFGIWEAIFRLIRISVAFMWLPVSRLRPLDLITHIVQSLVFRWLR